MTCGDERDESCCRDGHGHGGCGGHGHGHGHDDCRDGHGHHREGDGCCRGCEGGRGGRDQIAMFVVGPLETDCYAYLSGGECMVVDPGNSGAKIAEHLPVGATVRYIVATHGHGDHVGGVRSRVAATPSMRLTPSWPATPASPASRGAPTTTMPRTPT